MVTHDLSYALQLCPRALIMNRGVISADSPTAELLADTELLSPPAAWSCPSASTRPPWPAADQPGRSGPGRRLGSGKCRCIQARQAGSSLAAASAAPSPNR